MTGMKYRKYRLVEFSVVAGMKYCKYRLIEFSAVTDMKCRKNCLADMSVQMKSTYPAVFLLLM